MTYIDYEPPTHKTGTCPICNKECVIINDKYVNCDFCGYYGEKPTSDSELKKYINIVHTDEFRFYMEQPKYLLDNMKFDKCDGYKTDNVSAKFIRRYRSPSTMPFIIGNTDEMSQSAYMLAIFENYYYNEQYLKQHSIPFRISMVLIYLIHKDIRNFMLFNESSSTSLRIYKLALKLYKKSLKNNDIETNLFMTPKEVQIIKNSTNKQVATDILHIYKKIMRIKEK